MTSTRKPIRPIRKRTLRRLLRHILLVGPAYYRGLLYFEETLPAIATPAQIATVRSQLLATRSYKAARRTERRVQHHLSRITTYNINACPIGRPEEVAQEFASEGHAVVALICTRRGFTGRRSGVSGYNLSWFGAPAWGDPSGMCLMLTDKISLRAYISHDRPEQRPPARDQADNVVFSRQL
jgi:hypothetical protein